MNLRHSFITSVEMRSSVDASSLISLPALRIRLERALFVFILPDGSAMILMSC